jgi:hypothetical protein
LKLPCAGTSTLSTCTIWSTPFTCFDWCSIMLAQPGEAAPTSTAVSSPSFFRVK